MKIVPIMGGRADVHFMLDLVHLHPSRFFSICIPSYLLKTYYITHIGKNVIERIFGAGTKAGVGGHAGVGAGMVFNTHPLQTCSEYGMKIFLHNGYRGKNADENFRQISII